MKLRYGKLTMTGQEGEFRARILEYIGKDPSQELPIEQVIESLRSMLSCSGSTENGDNRNRDVAQTSLT